MLFRVLWISKTSLLFSVFLKFVVVNVMSADKGEPFHLNLRFKNNTGFLYFILYHVFQSTSQPYFCTEDKNVLPTASLYRIK